MDLQPARQFDYLQRTLSIFLTNSSNMSEQFEKLISELIKECKQVNKSPKHSPESSSSSSSDAKIDSQIASNSPQPMPKKRSAPNAANSKPPPAKRLKPTTNSNDTYNNEADDNSSSKKKKLHNDDKITKSDPDNDDDEGDDDDNDDNQSKLKSSESHVNPSSSSSRDIDEFAIELGLVCDKCKVLTEEKDNRLVECHECHAKYHQKCHKPPVSTTDISDPRCLWYCSKCRKVINKRQQSQTTIKDTKANSNNSSVSTTKSKPNESLLSTNKKGLPTSITDVTSGLFSFKPKSSDSLASDTTITSNLSTSNSNSSLVNGIAAKNTNGWASLATGFKEKKSTSDVSNASSNTSASSILAELTAFTGPANNDNLKRSPPSPKTSSLTLTPSLNPLLKPSTSATGALKTISSTSLTSLKQNKPTSPPVLKPQISSSSSSSVKPVQKVLSTSKILQRISSPTPLGRPPSVVKSPPSTTTPTYNRLNSSGSNSSGSSSPSSMPTTNTKLPTNFDLEKRFKQMKKMAAEKSLTKKF